MKKILLSMLFGASAMHAFSQVTTFAGSGIAGYADGPASAAQFDYPNGIVIDKAGNFYVADWTNCMIRRITPSGIVSTFAGSATRGYMDGLASVAQFNDPWGLAIDTADNIYVADAKNNVIRKITPAGMVSTLAGSGSVGFADGFGTAASFNYPATIAIDKNGNLYVGDGGNNRVRKITPSGMVTTIAGTSLGGFMDGPVATAQFRVPTCMVVTASGDIFVSDRDNNAIRKISGGKVTTFAGGTNGYADGKGTAAQFNNPHGLLLDDDGSLFVADTRNSRIRKIDTGGNVTTIAGSVYGFNDGPFASALFSMPKCLAKDKKGNLYVTDEINNRVRKLSGVAVTGVTEYTTNPALAYPNPAGQIITLQCPVGDANTQIVFYDMKGEVVLNKSVPTPSMELKESVSIAELPQGNYLVQIISGASFSNTRISKF